MKGFCIFLFKKLVLIFFMILAVFVFTQNIFSHRSTQEQNMLDEQYIQILKLMGEKKYEKVILRCKKIIRQDSTFYKIYPPLIQASRERKELHKTVKYLQTLITREPDNPYFYYAIGLCFKEQKKYNKAVENFEKSIKLKAEFADTYTKFIDISKELNKLSEAKAYIENIIKTNSNTPLAYYGLGYIYQIQGKWNKGLKNLDKALKLKSDFPEVYISKGTIYLSTSKCELAQEILTVGLKLAEKKNDKELKLRFLNLIGNSYYYVSNFSKALEYYKQVLRIAKKIYNKRGQGIAQANIGLIYSRLANYPEALANCQQSLKIAEEIGFKRLEGYLYSYIGIIYYETGNYRKALEYYKKNLEILEQTGDKFRLGGTYNEIGLVYFKLGDYQKALDYFEKGLEIDRAIGNKWVEGITLGNMGLVYYEINNLPKAIEYCQQSLKINQEIGYKRDEGYVLNFLGNINLKLRDYSKSLQLFEKTLRLGKEINVPEIIWSAYSGQAACYEKINKYHQALNYYKKAIETIEGVRGILQTKEQKSEFLKDKIEIYESLINLLFKMHQKDPLEKYDKQAFYYLEKSKARAFLDSLAEANVDISNDIPSELLEREKEILNNIYQIQTKLADLGLSIDKRNELYKKLQNVEDEYDFLKQEIRYLNPNYANLVYPEPYNLKEIQEKLLDKKTALIEYLIGDKNSFAFLITKNNLCIHKLSESKSLRKRVNYYIGLFSSPERDKFKGIAASKKLYKELIFPFQKNLEDIENLIIIPDGNLHCLPFETLITEDRSQKTEDRSSLFTVHRPLSTNFRYLIQDFKISYAPSASSLINLLEREQKEKTKKDILGFANPLYIFKEKPGKKIVPKADIILREYYLDHGFKLYPLFFSAKEIKNISKYFKRKSREFYLKEEAKEEKVKRLSLKDYKIIHFATHGLLDENVAGRSALVLTLDEDPTEDGFLQVREIYNIRLNADLVVLSACQSGKGKIEKGEGVSGLARAFLYAGAESVLVSLWSINDKSTAQFMTYFYEYLSQGKSKSEALRQTKIKMLKSNYNHPFHWAAFILIGDYNSSIKISKPSFWERLF
ncbi:MAG: CHAT domain-containing protein [Candidatus Aminicenantia bacterium]